MRFKFWNLILLFFCLFLSLVDGQQPFNIIRGNKKGSCDASMARINEMIDHGKTFATALKGVIDNAESDTVATKLVVGWFKINFSRTTGGGLAVNSGDQAAWRKLKRNVRIINEFWNGQGYPGMINQPMLFCNDGFGQQVEWTDGAKDKNGKAIQGMTVEGIFPYQKAYRPDRLPFWVADQNDYYMTDIDGDLCDGDTMGISFGGYRGPEHQIGDVSPSVLMKEDVVVICPRQFADNPNNHPANFDAVQYVHPDTNPDFYLYQALPRPVTLFHEMVHITTSHVSYNPSNPQVDPEAETVDDHSYRPEQNYVLPRDDAVNNAESYCDIALAWWYYKKNWGNGREALTFYNPFIKRATWPDDA